MILLKIILGVLAGLTIFFLIGVRKYKKKLISIRDNANFRTYEGRAVIKECNKKLDTLNGFDVWRKFKRKK